MRLINIICLSALSLVTISKECHATCECDIVESMPDGLNLRDPDGVGVVRTHESLLDIVEKAKKTLRIASFYWYLTPPADLDGDPSTAPGHMLMDAITRATTRGVEVQIVLDQSSRKEMNNPDDITKLEKISSIRYLNMTKLLHSGVMHTKFMIADNETFYVGSSNFDWRSYTQIKEMGLTFRDCAILAQDLDKFFRTFIMLSGMDNIPDHFTDDLKTTINMDTPLELKMKDSGDATVFLAGSPPPFNGKSVWTGRTDDIDALLRLIERARHRISISVMNYSPRMEFVWPKKYWPRIDDALRQAATTRRVKVELLFSNWTSTRSSELAWYRSLNAIRSDDFRGGGIHVKLFQVPAFNDYQKKIPFARVKHDKYMVTDGGVYLGTSNWTPDYFVNTVGVAVLIQPKYAPSYKEVNSMSALPIIKNFQDIFDRDFNSEYAHDL